MSPSMSKLNEGLTSFQQEFNRLSFLASIATDQTSTSVPTQSLNQQIFSESAGKNSSVSPIILPQLKTTQKVDNKVNNITIQNKLGQISSLLNKSHTNVQPKSTPKTIRPRAHTPRGPRVRNIKPAITNGKMQLRNAGHIQMVQFASPTTQNLQQIQVSQASFPQGLSQLITPGSKIPLQQINGKVITQPQSLLINKIQGGTIVMPTTQGNVNQPIIFSNIVTSSSMMPQQHTTHQVTANGQTFLLPANLAGISGKVLIVNPSTKGQPQSFTLAQSPSNLQNIQAIQRIQVPSKKAQHEAKTSNQIIKKEKGQIAGIVSQNQPIKTSLKSNLSNKKKQIQQPVSLSAFQTIRPKSFPTIQPKILAKPPILQTIQPNNVANKVYLPFSQTITPNAVATSINSSNSSVIQDCILVSSSTPTNIYSNVKLNQNQVTTQTNVNNQLSGEKKYSSTTTHLGDTNSSNQNTSSMNLNNNMKNTLKVNLPNMFDKTMSQHLLMLQKTDPHLFYDKNITSETSNISTTTVTTTSVKSSPSVKSSFLQSVPNGQVTDHFKMSKQTASNATNITKQQGLLNQLQLKKENSVDANRSTDQSLIIENILKQQLELQKQRNRQIEAIQLQHQQAQQQQVQLLQQQLLQQLSTAKVSVATTPNQTIFPIQQVLMPNNVSGNHLQASQQHDAPLKLLSTLTNNVNSSLSTPVSHHTTAVISNSSGNVQPIIVQIPESQLSSQILQANQITPAQLLELQKRFRTVQATDPKKNSTFTFKTTGQQSNLSFSNLENKNNTMRIVSNRLANPSQMQASQIIETVVNNPQVQIQDDTIVAKALEDIKTLTPAQKSMILRKLKKSGIDSKKVSNNILSSILKNKLISTKTNATKGNSTINIVNDRPQPLAPKLGKRAIEKTEETIQEHPLTKRWKHILTQDQVRHNSPNTALPFQSMDDVIHRLLPYHISNETHENTKHFDDEFDSYAQMHLKKRNELFSRLDMLFLKEAKSEYCMADMILCNRILVRDEEEQFSQQKSIISQGCAFVVRNEAKDILECVEVKTTAENVSSSATTAEISLNLSDQQQLDRRLKIAHKDINNMKMDDTDSDDDVIQYDDVVADNDDVIIHSSYDDEKDISFTNNLSFELDDDVISIDDENRDEHNGFLDNSFHRNEEIEIEEISTAPTDSIFTLTENNSNNMLVTHSTGGDYGGDDEMAAATTNLLADLQQGDEDDVFNLDFLL